MSKRFGSFTVVCIEKGYEEDGLTYNKDYEIDNDCVIESGAFDESYIMMNDFGFETNYYSNLFKRKSLIREDKLKKILNG